jgi:ActR/RegA family two-component response regulator
VGVDHFPLFGSAPIFAADDSSTDWPDREKYLGRVQEVVNTAFANIQTPLPKMESAVSFEIFEMNRPQHTVVSLILLKSDSRRMSMDDLRQYRVLVVEYNTAWRDLLSSILQEYTVVTVANSADAFKVIMLLHRQARFDVAIIDMHLSDKPGDDSSLVLTKEIKFRMPECQIIVLTGYADAASTRLDFKDINVFDYLEKFGRNGFDIDKLRDTVYKAILFSSRSLQQQVKAGNIAKATPQPEPEVTPPLEVQTLRVDAAVPEQVFVDRVFDLAVAVRQIASPPLAVKDLKHVESGEVQTAWQAGAVLINLRAEVDAPDCDIVGKTNIQFQLARGKDAPPIYFHLKPRRAGELSIIVTVYQEDYALGSARVSTLAAEQTTPPAGKVQLTVASQPLWLDCELRVLDSIDRDCRVELTLNNEQVFHGMAGADLAAWAETGDPVVDGQALFKALLDDNELLKAWGEARGRSKPRRIRLRIDPPALHALPWELLRDGAEAIAADADTPFSRYLPIGKAWGRALGDRPLRVLAVIANPSDLKDKYDLPAADVELEKKILREALGMPHPPTPSPDSYRTNQERGSEAGVRLTFLTPPITLARLEAELRNGYHVLHFIGHGGFNTKQQQAALYFEDDDGAAQRVIDADFAGMLDRLQTPPQLVVLAACQSATQSLSDVFTGLGPKLVQIGLPAVVAMQADITMLTARRFAATFYRQLIAHGTIDLAMNEARSTLITNGRYDVAVPVLFMRLRDGLLWGSGLRDVSATPIEPPQPIGRATLSKKDRASLERQLASLRETLRLYEERKAQYTEETDVPLKNLKEERRLKERIAELEQKLSGG